MATFRVRVPDKYAAGVTALLLREFADRPGFGVEREQDTGPMPDAGANPDFDRLTKDTCEQLARSNADRIRDVVRTWSAVHTGAGSIDGPADGSDFRATREPLETAAQGRNYNFEYRRGDPTGPLDATAVASVRVRDERLEKAAYFAYQAYWLPDGPPMPWEKVGEKERGRWRQAADAALMSAGVSIQGPPADPAAVREKARGPSPSEAAVGG